MSTQRSALLIVDMFNRFDFDGGEQLAHRAQGAARSIDALAQRYRQAQRPVLYANDNFADWHADLPALIALASQADARGCEIARLLTPYPQDYQLLKPKHSAFLNTPLAPLVATPQGFDQVLRMNNPAFAYADHDAQGYAVATVTPATFSVVFTKVKPLDANGAAPTAPLAKRTRITLANGSTTPRVEDNVA